MNTGPKSFERIDIGQPRVKHGFQVSSGMELLRKRVSRTLSQRG